MHNTIDMIGKKFGKLTVIERSGTHVVKHSKYALWKCKCDCGNEVILRGASLRNGNSKSCGCLRRENTSIALTKHNHSNHRLYRIWIKMKHRCINPNSPSFKQYGGRGIKICDEWFEFPIFYDWAMNNGYKDNLTIDRIEVNGNYEPLNCRWATRKVQGNNKTNNHFIEYKGEKYTLSQLAEKFNINYGTLASRLKKEWPIEKALLKPVQRKKNKTP